MLAKHAQWLSYISSFYYILPSILNLHSSVDALMLSTHLVFVCLSWFGYCCHFLEELGFELRALYLLGKHSTWTIFPSPSTFFSKQELLNFNTNRKQDHHSLTTRAIHTCTRTHTHTHTHTDPDSLLRLSGSCGDTMKRLQRELSTVPLSTPQRWFRAGVSEAAGRRWSLAEWESLYLISPSQESICTVTYISYCFPISFVPTCCLS
jgi:hypothetical protein